VEWQSSSCPPLFLFFLFTLGDLLHLPSPLSLSLSPAAFALARAPSHPMIVYPARARRLSSEAGDVGAAPKRIFRNVLFTEVSERPAMCGWTGMSAGGGGGRQRVERRECPEGGSRLRGLW
jgi:hypothetical protein